MAATTTDHERVARCRDDLIPHAVDRLARERPDAQYAEWVTGDSVIVVTYAQLANLVNGLAWWLVDRLGGPGSYGPDAEVLTYVGPNDARYGALVLAAIKAGYVVGMPFSFSCLCARCWLSLCRLLTWLNGLAVCHVAKE